MTFIDKIILIFLPISHLIFLAESYLLHKYSDILWKIFNTIFPKCAFIVGCLAPILVIEIYCIVASIKIICGLDSFEPEQLAKNKLFRLVVTLCPIAFLASMVIPSENIRFLFSLSWSPNDLVRSLAVPIYILLCMATTVIAAFAVYIRPGKAAVQSFGFSWLWSGPAGILFLSIVSLRPCPHSSWESLSYEANPYILLAISFVAFGVFINILKKQSPRKQNRRTDWPYSPDWPSFPDC